jgi:Integrase zinc binding domain/Integrase core domain
VTDHKPLVTMLGNDKPIPPMAASRMQRWAYFLSGFDYKVVYRKGEQNGNADMLSRLPNPAVEAPVEKGNYLNYIGYSGPPVNLDILKKETSKDPILIKVKNHVMLGKPIVESDLELKPFASRLREISWENGVLMWGYKIIIPSALQHSILEMLHIAHAGIVRTKSVARSYLWWPKMDSDIENKIKACVPCGMVKASPQKAELIPWTVPDQKWERIHVDFGGPIAGEYIWIAVDAFSKWVEVFTTKQLTAKVAIEKVMEICARFGLVKTLVSDGGPAFKSERFQSFLAQNNMKHIISPPGHPSSNGQAENTIRTVKTSIRAAVEAAKRNQTDLNLNEMLFNHLMTYRSTKHAVTQESPAKLMLGWEIRTIFDSMRPVSPREVIIGNKTIQKNYHRGERKRLLEEGQAVLVADYTDPNAKRWVPATIYEKLGQQTYQCKLETGRILKRHLNQIKVLEEEPTDVSWERSDSSEDPISDSSEYVDASGTTSDLINDDISYQSSEDEDKSIKRAVEGGSTPEETSPIKGTLKRPTRNIKKPNRYHDLY